VKNLIKINRLFVVVLLVYPYGQARAQLCTGSLGDPVVNITFGVDNNIGAPGYAPANAYTFTSSTCPSDGFYTITSATAGCFGDTWHTITNDHSGNGNFMLINASYTPGDFFVTPVTNLCPNTTYEFAAWIMNVLNRNAIKPNVSFTIEQPDGTLLGQYNTGDIAETLQPRWQQYGLFFTTPAADATIVLRITNNAPGGVGNDLALDDITFRPCGGEIKAQVTGYTDTIDFCEGNTEVFRFTSSVSTLYQDPVYFWQISVDSGHTWADIPGVVSANYTRLPTGPGKFLYRLTISEKAGASIKSCRIASNTIVINVHAKPNVNAGQDRFVIRGDSLQIEAVVKGEDPVYTWSPAAYLSVDTILNPLVTPPSDQTYTLFATSAFGCTNQDQVTIKVIGGIYIPTAFTPNGDGRNDVWQIPYLDPDWDATAWIYNRYGQLIYQGHGTGISWNGTINGKPQATGVYIYLVSLRKKNRFLKGTITLIR